MDAVSSVTAPISAAAEALLNHLLDGQPWLRERFIPFSGRTARLDVFPVSLTLVVGSNGALTRVDTDAQPDAVVRLSPLTLLRLAVRDEAARASVEADGDAAFAAVLGGVLRELRWDAEEDLSKLVGDIPARRLAQAGEAFFAWQRQAAMNLAQSAADFWIEEQPLLARKADVENWADAVDAVRDDVERVEKRLERLLRPVESPP